MLSVNKALYLLKKNCTKNGLLLFFSYEVKMHILKLQSHSY